MEERLSQLISKNKVIPFVGAGVSLSIKDKNDKTVFVTWKELLKKLAVNLSNYGKSNKSQIINLLIEEDEDYLEIADKIKKYYPLDSLFFDKLEEIFDIKKEIIDDSSLSLARSIWDLEQKLIITTNYDNVLDWAAPKKIKALDIQSDYELASSIRTEIDEETVLYLHGHIDKKSNMILTTENYNRLYNDSSDSKFKIAINTLKTKLATKSFLFIGYSLDDEFFINELERVCDNFGNNSSEHYILLEEGKTLPKKFNKRIIPIYFESKGQKLIDKINSLKSLPQSKPISVVQEEINFCSLTSLPAINNEFIGRKDELLKIEENLNSDSLIYIVNGIGGVGKSEVSSQYLHQNKDKYKNIAFIEMTEDTASLEELFITKFKNSLGLDDKVTFDTVIQVLQSLPKKNLLLLDNLENKQDFEKIKALNINFDLLITTRITDIDIKNQLNLDTLNDEDAKELFLSIYDKDDDIEDILDYLDNHPLFINLTAKSLSKEYITLEELRENIKNQTISKIDSKDDKTFKEHLESTYNKQFKSVDNPELKELLQLLAFFPSIEISFEILEKCLCLDKLKVKLQKLVERGWLSKKDNTYKLHQIIKTFILNEYKLDYENITFILKNILEYINLDDSTLIANRLNGYIPIIESFLNTFRTKEDEYICGILDSITFLLYSLAQYDKSLYYQNKSLKIRIKLFGEKSEFTARSQNLLSTIYQAMGKLPKALDYQEKALTLRKEVLGKKHLDLARSYNNISAIYKVMGKLPKALEYQEKALTLLKTLTLEKEILGENHPDLAISYNNISTIYRAMGELPKALEYQEKALTLRKEILGEKHPDLAQSYNNISGIYRDSKECKKAKEYIEKAIDIWKNTGYYKKELFNANEILKKVKSNIKKERKAKFKDKGRFCKDSK
ncbi:tetratricopeptide repeat protein [Poseidonibacter antarcticus]|uniref:tetratricopeptide repeat protein n=1 Tax=Poseidonibacter antarcticus TaxID=2478538 RepID=UPI000EF543C5|nr:tetratricopeptide repeat protein [Poseidonibacter antarcticus]